MLAKVHTDISTTTNASNGVNIPKIGSLEKSLFNKLKIEKPNLHCLQAITEFFLPPSHPWIIIGLLRLVKKPGFRFKTHRN
jgi:hypothetical protein